MAVQVPNQDISCFLVGIRLNQPLTYHLQLEGSTGAGYIHKSKLNQNETFSVGKTWLLSDLRSIVVTNVRMHLTLQHSYSHNYQPVIFNLTLSRTYQWESAFAVEQTNFLEALIKLFRTVTGGASSLHLEGLRDPDNARRMLFDPFSFATIDFF